MEVGGQSLAGQNADVVRVVCNFVRVHNSAWNLDGPHEVEVVVAQVVRERLNFLRGHRCRVLNHEVVHGEGSGNRGPVRDHVEIEAAVAISRCVLSQTGVDDRTRRWIGVVVASALDKSSVDLFVDEAVDELRVIIWLNTSDSRFNLRRLIPNDLLLVAGTSDAVPVDRDLLWQGLIDLEVLVESAQDKVDDDVGSVLANLLLLLVFGDLLSNQVVKKVLPDDLSIVLSEVAGVGGGHSNYCGATSSHNVSANNHGVLHLLIHFQAVQVFLALGVDLLEDV